MFKALALFAAAAVTVSGTGTANSNSTSTSTATAAIAGTTARATATVALRDTLCGNGHYCQGYGAVCCFDYIGGYCCPRSSICYNRAHPADPCRMTASDEFKALHEASQSDNKVVPTQPQQLKKEPETVESTPQLKEPETVESTLYI